MKLKEEINRILAVFDIALIRRSTLEKLTANTATPAHSSSVDNILELKQISKNAFASIEGRIDNGLRELLRQQISAKWEVVDYLDRSISITDSTETCPLCNHEDSAAVFPKLQSQCIFGGGRLIRLQCPACDVIFGAKKMLALNPAELTQDYETHYKVYQEGDSTEQEIRAFHLLSPQKDGVYLNYGAGAWSKSVQTLRSQGWNVFAFEPHDSAAASHDYLIRSKEDLLKMKFDGIFSNNVLEHLRHPVEELSFMREILKPGSRMSHATPCFEYLYEFTRFHLFFYIGRSRKILAEQSGLSISEFVVDNEFMCALYERERV